VLSSISRRRVIAFFMERDAILKWQFRERA
jgi:hypothetical protein